MKMLEIFLAFFKQAKVVIENTTPIHAVSTGRGWESNV